MSYKKSLKLGTHIEKEHRNTYNKMKRTKCRMTLQQFARSTAKDHIKELGNRYYPELIKMEKRIKKRRYYAKK